MASARAIATRCRCPPESWSGRRRPNDGSRPTSSSSCGTRPAAPRARLAAQEVERLGDDRVDRHHRIERVARILEDHLHAAAVLPRDAAVPADLERAPLEDDRAAGAIGQPEQQAGDRRLPRPRLADQAERLAREDLERDTVDRAQVAPAEAEAPAHPVALREVGDLHERRAGRDGRGRRLDDRPVLHRIRAVPRLLLEVARDRPPRLAGRTRAARCGRARARGRSGSALRSGSRRGSRRRAAASPGSRRARCRARP